MSHQTYRLPQRRTRLMRQGASAALAVSSIILLVAGFLAATAQSAVAADARVSLGTTSSYAVLAGSAVTNTGPSVLSGDVGLSPGSSVTGFPPGIVINGTKHVADAVALTAKADLVTAYNDAAARPTAADVTGQNLGGMTLTPGVYEASSSMGLTGTLTLNAQGNSAAVFIFKAGSTLVTATNSRVQFVNGGSPCNVFWQVGSSATLGTATQFVGTILALTSATLNTTATVEGRVLARNGAVTLDNNVITSPACTTANPSSIPSATATTPAEVPVLPNPTLTEGTDTSSTATPTPTGNRSGTPTPGDTPSNRTPGPTPTIPVVPRDHPDTGLGGLQTPAKGVLLLAGILGAGAVVAGAIGFRRSEEER